jgi:hypothetical protein
MSDPIDTTPALVGPYDLWRGASWAPGTITVSSNGTPVNFSTYTVVALEIISTVTGLVVATLSTTTTGLTASSVGVITPIMNYTTTAALAAGDYQYQTYGISAAGIKTYYTHGTIAVKNVGNS